MPQQAQTPQRPHVLSEVLECEYKALGIPLDLRAADASEPAGDDLRCREIFRQAASIRPLSALCISGGGIRSATFSLGVVQGLARKGLLRQFDYLSTVSGGGYIGSWLSAWIHRAGGADQVEPRLNSTEPGQAPAPVHHLREYNSYLTPRTGLASVDTWTLSAIVLRNLLLNWCLMIPLLMLLLMAPRIFTAVLQIAPPGQPAPPVITDIVKWTAALLFCVATINVFRSLPSVGGANVSDRAFKLYCFGPLVGSVLCFVTWTWWNWEGVESLERLIGRPEVLMQAVLSMTAASWLLYVVLVRRRLRDLVGPVALGVLIFGISTGFGVYACTAWLLTSMPAAGANPAVYATFAPVLFTLVTLSGGIVFVGVTSYHLGEDDREWLARAAAHFCMFTVAWLLLCGTVLLAPRILFQAEKWAQSVFVTAGGLSGILTAIIGRSSRTPRQSKPDPDAAQGWGEWLPQVTMITFVVALVVGLSAISNALVFTTATALTPVTGRTVQHLHRWFDHDDVIIGAALPETLTLTLVLLAISMIAGRFININRFSLHGMYRNRLVRAYLGASNPDQTGRSAFTGFNSGDNIAMKDLRDQRPLHIVNAALNLVSGKRLDWQQRKAESFTFSPFFTGNAHCGYRDSAEYAGGVTLGTAVTISGAAASPNMGYHSSPLVGLVMMLFNARLGGWFGNPGHAGEKTWKHDGPQSAVSPVIREAGGMTTDGGDYVYLSDGGHFENLALYEMVVRRCRHIVVIDGGCDGDYTYEDLGNALRKIRIDLGIHIDFEPGFIAGLRKREKRCAIATILYSAVGHGPDGTLLYIKPLVTGEESPDVLTYHSTSSAFPHESTSDQWFTEAQTESYRMLGVHTVECIGSGWTGTDLESFLAHAGKSYLGAAKAATA